MRAFPRSLFSTCAAILSGERADHLPDYAAAGCFLKDLDYVNAQGEVCDPSLLPTRVALLRCAQTLDLFSLEVPDAPRMLFIGGRVLPERLPGLEQHAPSSTSGISLRLAHAFESSVGEGIEYLSQLAPVVQHSDTRTEHVAGSQADLDRWQCYGASRAQSDSVTEWLDGRCLMTSATVPVPSRLCLRSPNTTTLRGMSSGCAAGVSHDQAHLYAILELIERDAAALWWEGGSTPRPISVEAMVDAGIEALFVEAGRHSEGKATLLLDITTDVGVPVVAAISADVRDGARFACGLACRVSVQEAIRKAVYEMMQMELAHHLLESKRRALGDQSLTTHDHQQLYKSDLLRDLWNTQLLQPCGQPQRYAKSENQDAGALLGGLLEQLKLGQPDVIAVDLTRDRFALPVVKVFIPSLQSYPIQGTTQRLSALQAAGLTTDQYHGGVSLL